MPLQTLPLQICLASANGMKLAFVKATCQVLMAFKNHLGLIEVFQYIKGKPNSWKAHLAMATRHNR